MGVLLVGDAARASLDRPRPRPPTGPHRAPSRRGRARRPRRRPSGPRARAPSGEVGDQAHEVAEDGQQDDEDAHQGRGRCRCARRRRRRRRRSSGRCGCGGSEVGDGRGGRGAGWSWRRACAVATAPALRVVPGPDPGFACARVGVGARGPAWRSVAVTMPVLSVVIHSFGLATLRDLTYSERLARTSRRDRHHESYAGRAPPIGRDPAVRGYVSAHDLSGPGLDPRRGGGRPGRRHRLGTVRPQRLDRGRRGARPGGDGERRPVRRRRRVHGPRHQRPDRRPGRGPACCSSSRSSRSCPAAWPTRAPVRHGRRCRSCWGCSRTACPLWACSTARSRSPSSSPRSSAARLARRRRARPASRRVA